MSCNILRTCATVFQSECAILHSHPQCTSVPISSYARQHLLLSIFLVLNTHYI